jgi:hypothetical protein
LLRELEPRADDPLREPLPEALLRDEPERLPPEDLLRDPDERDDPPREPDSAMPSPPSVLDGWTIPLRRRR